MKKVDKRSKCVEITIDKEDERILEDYMNVYKQTRSTALKTILLTHIYTTVDKSAKWKSRGGARQLKMYMSSKEYNQVKRVACSRQMKTNEYIRSVVISTLRDQCFEVEIYSKQAMDFSYDPETEQENIEFLANLVELYEQ